MKRLTAILLLLIVVFNLYGYRLVISYLQGQNNTQLEASIDQKDYNESELISIKTTLNLPYYSNSPEFERVYGSISIDGVEYEYVKRRIHHDTLELLCLPNYKKTALNSVSNEIAKSLADYASSPGKKQTVLKITLPDYCQSFSESQFGFFETPPTIYRYATTNFRSADYSLLQDRPPQFNA